MKGKLNLKKAIIDGLVLLVACMVGAYSTTAVLLPNGLTSGGLTGIVRLLQVPFGLSFSALYYLLAIGIWIFVFLCMGFREARKVLTVTLLYPAVLFVFERLDFQLLEEKDILLAAVFCGIFGGVCNGLVFWRGYAFCGTESIAKILRLKFFPHIELGRILLILDGIVIVISAVLFGRNVALYALITLFINVKMIGFILYGFESKVVQMEIITSKSQELAVFIMEQVGRGVSSREIVGEYTRTKRTQIVVLCSPRQSMIIKQHLKELDPSAFTAILQVSTVWGEGIGFNTLGTEHV